MILLLTGASHTGKTLLAQRLLERLHIPYLSMDHVKMGLIRTGMTDLTPMDDEKMVEVLWPIIREIIKTAVENRQDLIVEGCYVPENWQADFAEIYLKEIHYLCLVMTTQYIENHFNEISEHGCEIEKRLEYDCDKQELIRENNRFGAQCKKERLPHLLISESYDVNAERALEAMGLINIPAAPSNGHEPC